MQIFTQYFNLLLHKPLFNALILLYLYLPWHDFGLAIIFLTILIRILLYPSMKKSIRSQKMLTDLQPKIQKIQQEFKDDKQRQTKEMMALYQREKINPFGSILPLLIQFPILVALYRIFWNWQGIPELLNTHLYSFVPHPGLINPLFLGAINLSAPNVILALLAGLVQFFQSKMFSPSSAKNTANSSKQVSQISGMMQKQMLYFFPIFTVLILWGLPSAVGLYWITTGLFSILQQYLIFKEIKNAQPS